jgi:hypothetical protein
MISRFEFEQNFTVTFSVHGMISLRCPSANQYLNFQDVARNLRDHRDYMYNDSLQGCYKQSIYLCDHQMMISLRMHRLHRIALISLLHALYEKLARQRSQVATLFVTRISQIALAVQAAKVARIL